MRLKWSKTYFHVLRYSGWFVERLKGEGGKKERKRRGVQEGLVTEKCIFQKKKKEEEEAKP